MGKRTVEKASAGSEKGLFADAQSLRQSSLRCGTRFVGAAEEPRQVAGSSPSGNAQSLKQSSLRCGTRFVGAAEEPRLAELRFAPCYSLSQTARRAAISSPHPESLSFGVSR